MMRDAETSVGILKAPLLDHSAYGDRRAQIHMSSNKYLGLKVHNGYELRKVIKLTISPISLKFP